MSSEHHRLLPAIEASLLRARGERNLISTERRQLLTTLAEWIAGEMNSGNAAELIFICTHNSRRSHLSQLWAQAAALWNGLPDVHCYSGGTEATAFNTSAITALRGAGFEITTSDISANPRYTVRLGDDAEPLIAFSKEYGHDENPAREFCAVMTCSQADEGCPVVIGAAKRISLPFDDPKAADGTPEEAAVYEERSRQIAREMLFAMDAVPSLLQSIQN